MTDRRGEQALDEEEPGFDGPHPADKTPVEDLADKVAEAYAREAASEALEEPLDEPEERRRFPTLDYHERNASGDVTASVLESLAGAVARAEADREDARPPRHPTLQGPARGPTFNERVTLAVPPVRVEQALEAARAAPNTASASAGSPRTAAARPASETRQDGPAIGGLVTRSELGPAPDPALALLAATEEPESHRVRSTRLQHVRSKPIKARENPPDRRPTRSHLPSSSHRVVPLIDEGWYRRLLLLALIVLLEAALLPGWRDGALVVPWVALASPGSPAFVATAFLLLLGAVAALPVGLKARAAAGAVLGLLLTTFGLVMTSAAVSSGGFDGQPALQHIFTEAPAGRGLLLLTIAALPAALFWRRQHPGSLGARIMVATATVLVLFLYTAGHLLGLAEGSPLVELVTAGRTAPFLGDRLAAWLALLPFILAPASLVTLAGGSLRRGAGTFGVLLWLLALAPLWVLAAFVAPLDRWYETLAPLQVSSLLAAGLLVVAAATGQLLAATLVPAAPASPERRPE